MVTKNLSTFCPCPKTLWVAQFKYDELINVVEEISKQLSIKDMAWFFLVTFSQIYSENCEQKAEQKVLKNLHFD
jgi:hypothetical protein